MLSDILTRFAPLPSIHRDPSGQIPLITPPCLFGRASPGCPRGLRGESLGFVGHPATSAYQRAASPRSTTWGQPRWLPRSCCSSSASGRTALSAGLLRVHARSYIHAPSPRAVPVLGQPVQIPCHAGWPSHLRWLVITTVVLGVLPAHNTANVRSRVSLQMVTRPSQADCPWLACYRMRSSTWAVVVIPGLLPASRGVLLKDHQA